VDRRFLTHDLPVLVPSSLERAGFLVAFTERNGGASAGRFRSLNLGRRTGDRISLIVENRRRVAEAMGVPPFTFVEQVHGAGVAEITDDLGGRGFDPADDAIPGADALWSRSRGTALAVMAADCLPIAVASPVEGILMLVHAGWRGLAAGLLQAAMARFADPGVAKAAIGPAIGSCHYRVGAEVIAAVDRGSGGAAVWVSRDGHPYLDLAATAAGALRATGVTEVEAAGECTACHPERFFSHRRDGPTGRQAAVAMKL
jgi:YfiH family protein